MDEINEIKYKIDREEREKLEDNRERINSKLYLGEIIRKEKPHFTDNSMILSPVGSGKSYLIENMLIPKGFNKRAIYLTSNTALKDSVSPDDNEVRRLTAEKGVSRGFYTTANKSKFGNVDYSVHVMTYSEFGERMLTRSEELLEDVEIVFCDEIHSLPTYFDYDKDYKLAVAMFWLFKKQEGVKIYYFTATNESLSLLKKKDPERLRDVKVFNYLDHPNIMKYVAKSTHYVNHIEQTRIYLRARKESFDYYGDKALAFTKLIKEQEKIKEIAEEEGFTPLMLWSVNNEENKMTEEQLRARDIILRTGLIPEPYNILIINGSMQEGWNLFDKAVVLAILNTTDLTEQIQALGRIRKDIDLVIKKTNDSSLLDNNVDIPSKYLNTNLTAGDKKKLSDELEIYNDRGEIKRWRTLKKEIEQSNYEVKDTTVRIDGKRTRVSIITPK